MNRLLVAFPLYVSVSTKWFVNFLAMDHSPVVGHVATRKLYLAKSMNEMCASSIEQDDWDRLVVFEADVCPPPDAFVRIAHYPDTVDIVGSVYLHHPDPHDPVVYRQVEENAMVPFTPDRLDTIMAEPGLYPADVVGFGFTSIHRNVLEKWDENVPMFGGETQIGHDFWFCREARRQGFRVYVDSGISCSHLTEVPVVYHPRMNDSAPSEGAEGG